MPPSIRVLALFAHPDDAEFLCAGTLAHLAERGDSLHIASMTAGDCGSSILSSAKISRIRRQEAQRGAALLHAPYTCLGERDLLVAYDRPTLRKVMELVRRVDPALVFTHSPQDYMADHETTSRLCQTACFGASAPNFRTGAPRPAPAVRTIPHLYYAQPYGNRDILGNEILPRLVVDISATLEQKEKMLACHESQRAWLQFQQALRKIEDPLRQMAARAGELASFPWGEGFRQHLGAAFPQENLLGSLLGDLVHPAIHMDGQDRQDKKTE
ncbi:MAG: PIG-L deacetylase family protein [Terriglobia bacterium]|jgi:LmbE family N-acetylglucosaminyl deacetylase